MSSQSHCGETVIVRGTPDYTFHVEQHGERTRLVFEFVPAPDDRRLGKVIDYLTRASAPYREAVPNAR